MEEICADKHPTPPVLTKDAPFFEHLTSEPAPNEGEGDGVLRFELTNLQTVLNQEAYGCQWLEMCSAVQEGCFEKAFSAWDEKEQRDAIVDVQVVMNDFDESAPDQYKPLKSVSGGDGDINKKNGGRVVHLCIRRGQTSTNSNERDPITALSVVCDDQSQEPPLGFSKVEQTVGGRTADLSMGNGVQRTFLCYIRGTGPPIQDLALIFNSRKELAPPGYHRLVKTPNDDSADLSSLCKTGNEVFLCFRLDLRQLLHKFRIDGSSDRKWSASAALFVACLFSPSENVVVQALKSLHEILLLSQGLNVPLGIQLLNLVFQALCDSQIIARSHFTRTVQSLGLQVLLDGFLRYVYELRLETVLRVYETFFFERHKDRREALSIQIAEFLFSELAHSSQPTSRIEEESLHDASVSAEEGNISSWIRSSLLPGVIETIVLHKSCSRDMNMFQRSREINLSFRVAISDLLQRLCPQKHVHRLILGLLLTACKIESHPASFRQGTKSESIMRKIHALTLILRIISHSSAVELMTPRGPLLILRRFVCVSLLESCATVVPAIFKLVLSLFTELWQRYKHLLKTELGIIMDAVLLGMIQSGHCWPEQKIDLIEAIAQLFPTPSSLVDLFYNYDNDIQRRNLFGRLIRSLCQLSETQTMTTAIKGTKAKPNPQHPIHAAFLQSAHEANASQMNLQRTALTTVVGFLKHLAQFLSPPNLCFNECRTSISRSSSVVGIPMLEMLLTLSPRPVSKQSSFGSLFSAPDLTATLHKRSQSWCEIEAEEKKLDQAVRDKRIRSSTWVSRHMQQKKAQLLHAEAIALAKSESIKSAVAMLVDRRGSFDPDEIAMFFNAHANSLDKTEIGEFLAADFTRYMTADQFEQLRRSFMAMIDFTSMDLDSALRHFLVHSGFRLPGEAQKVDRLIQAFADAYVRDNPDLFPSDEAVYLVAFALIMLNTDMHDPRLRSGKQSRLPMNKAQFIRNVQGADSSTTMSVALLGQLFDGIAAKSIEWQGRSPDDGASLTSTTYQTGTSLTSATEKQFRLECELLCRQGLAWLKTASIRPRMYLSTDSKHIVKGMFEVVFPVLLLTLTTVLEKNSDFEVEIKTACIDGLKFASLIALAANAQEELDAFTGVLAKITFIELNKTILLPAQIRKSVVTGDHLNQSWVTDLKLLVSNRSKKAVSAIIQIANRTKKRLIFERDQSILLNIQNEFTDEVLLLDPERLFIREGHLTKVSSGSRLQIYRFFLFTDLILYAREQFQKLKLHKVVHLSMCRLMDLPDGESESSVKNSFKIVSPQKNFTVIAASANDKRIWMEDIQKQIEVCYFRHKQWVEAARSLPHDHTQSVSEAKDDTSEQTSDVTFHESPISSSQSSNNASRLMSSFIGRPKGSKGQHAQRGCRFCIRDFSMLRRKCICAWCSQTVCSNCSTHRLELLLDSTDARSPKKLQRVCDACFGHLNGSIDMEKPPQIAPP
uniref:SEC7 domain-containing protein n=1 Tax=Spongospora subterranea TaxID=70186 RepID=A0A0H5R9J9_9EUKA|eukprot:CRZ05109.1 hypothetical protein [Spongospora subterranea]